jgi:hypothetical protein
MNKKILSSVGLIALVVFGSIRAGHACSTTGPTCNTLLGTSCEGSCDGDLCVGTKLGEYLCTNGAIQYRAE